MFVMVIDQKINHHFSLNLASGEYTLCQLENASSQELDEAALDEALNGLLWYSTWWEINNTAYIAFTEVDSGYHIILPFQEDADIELLYATFYSQLFIMLTLYTLFYHFHDDAHTATALDDCIEAGLTCCLMNAEDFEELPSNEQLSMLETTIKRLQQKNISPNTDEWITELWELNFQPNAITEQAELVPAEALLMSIFETYLSADNAHQALQNLYQTITVMRDERDEFFADSRETQLPFLLKEIHTLMTENIDEDTLLSLPDKMLQRLKTNSKSTRNASKK